MAQNVQPVYSLTPNCPQARLAAANTARDGSGSLTTLFTAGSNGSRVDWIRFISAQASAAASSSMVVRVFVTDNAGANPRLLAEAVMTTLTPSTTVIGSVTVFDFINGIVNTNTGTLSNIGIFGGVVLQTGQLLKVSQSIFAGVQDQNDIICKGGDF